MRELTDFRCLILDRPGWVLSTRVDYRKSAYEKLIAAVLGGTLDALGIGRANVVGNSIGNVWALRLASAHPSRVGRVVTMGGGPLLSEETSRESSG